MANVYAQPRPHRRSYDANYLSADILFSSCCFGEQRTSMHHRDEQCVPRNRVMLGSHRPGCHGLAAALAWRLVASSSRAPKRLRAPKNHQPVTNNRSRTGKPHPQTGQPASQAGNLVPSTKLFQRSRSHTCYARGLVFTLVNLCLRRDKRKTPLEPQRLGCFMSLYWLFFDCETKANYGKSEAWSDVSASPPKSTRFS